MSIAQRETFAQSLAYKKLHAAVQPLGPDSAHAVMTIVDGLAAELEQNRAGRAEDRQRFEKLFSDERALRIATGQDNNELREERAELEAQLFEALTTIEHLQSERQQGTDEQPAEQQDQGDGCQECRRKDQRIREMQARETERANRYEGILEWTCKLFANSTIPEACKLVLWYYHYLFFRMRPDITGEEMRISVEGTAAALGIAESTVKKATDKAEMWEVLDRRYEPTTDKDGNPIKLMHIQLNDVVQSPDYIQMAKLHGGQRVRKCPQCGSEDVDQYSVRYCRHCDVNAWYGQPGLRADFDIVKAQRAPHMQGVMIGGKVRTGNNQDDSCMSDTEVPETPDFVAVSNRIDTALVVTEHVARARTRRSNRDEQAAPAADEPPTPSAIETATDTTTGESGKNQDEFYTSQVEVPEMPVVSAPAAAAIFSPPAQLDAEHSLLSTASSWQPMEKRTLTCKALIAINAEGKPAHALDKVVAQRECGSTHWRWSPIENCRVCLDCWTPAP